MTFPISRPCGAYTGPRRVSTDIAIDVVPQAVLQSYHLLTEEPTSTIRYLEPLLCRHLCLKSSRSLGAKLPLGMAGTGKEVCVQLAIQLSLDF